MINEPRQEYAVALPEWEEMKAVVAGQKQVKALGERFLPRLIDQSDEEYKAYKERAIFTSAASRVIDAWIGQATRKDSTVVFEGESSGNDDLKDLFPNITDSGNSIEELEVSILKNNLTTGRLGLLVDFSEETQNPFIKHYNESAIINWHSKNIGGEEVLIFVVLAEKISVFDESDHSWKETEQFRLLVLRDGFYQVEIHVVDDNGNVKVIDTRTPKINGKAQDRIPFVFINPETTDTDIKKPPILDVANKVIDFYRVGAGYAHALTWVSFPTPVIIGGGDDFDDGVTLGANLINIGNPDGDAKFLEFTGAGITALKEAMNDMKAEIAVMGSRALETAKVQVESSATQITRKGTELASLEVWVRACSSGLTKALNIMGQYVLADPLKYSINTDFESGLIDPQTLKELRESVKEGFYPVRDFFEVLKRNDLLPASQDFEQFKFELAEEVPMENKMQDNLTN
jgi:hypothetical protein